MGGLHIEPLDGRTAAVGLLAPRDATRDNSIVMSNLLRRETISNLRFRVRVWSALGLRKPLQSLRPIQPLD